MLGTALPDLLPLADDRVRLRPAQMARWMAQTEGENALSAGVSVHLATDAAFHKTHAFAEAQAEVSRLLAETTFDGIRVRRFFVSHVLTELALDAVLLRADPSLADRFYAALTAADFPAAAQWTEAVTGRTLPRLPGVLARFSRSEYLRHYDSDDGVATGLCHLCRRAGQNTFEGANFDRLAAVVQRVILVLPDFAPRLFSETIAGMDSVRQESAVRAAKPLSMTETQNSPERKFRIHFPLTQISAPVVTHLVTEYDLSPNLLRADISPQTGGWLVLGLTGDDIRLQTALAWLRGQGLEVTDEAE